jgi:Holliday junction resolvasome RuvABC endonuclease subunit
VKQEKENLENVTKDLKKDRIIGIDLSKKCPGVCIYDIDTSNIEYLDSFKVSGSPTEFERDLEILYWLLDIVTIYKPSKTIIESPYISKFTISSSAPLYKLHGLVNYFLFKYGIEVYNITPSSSRAHLKIKPNDKATAFNYIRQTYPELGLTSYNKDNDKADALILVLNHDNSKLVKVE